MVAHRQRGSRPGFSALQRAEIAEMNDPVKTFQYFPHVSVLFNEPKLLKFYHVDRR